MSRDPRQKPTLSLPAPSCLLGSLLLGPRLPQQAALVGGFRRFRTGSAGSWLRWSAPHLCSATKLEKGSRHVPPEMAKASGVLSLSRLSWRRAFRVQFSVMGYVGGWVAPSSRGPLLCPQLCLLRTRAWVRSFARSSHMGPAGYVLTHLVLEVTAPRGSVLPAGPQEPLVGLQRCLHSLT